MLNSFLKSVDFSTLFLVGALFFVLSEFFNGVDKYIDEIRKESEGKRRDSIRGNTKGGKTG